MTSRHDKQQARWQERDLIQEEIAKLAYWPAHWQVRVELATEVNAQRWFRRRKKKPPRETYLLLRLRETWRQDVLARGWAVLDGNFVLHAISWREREVPESVTAGLDELLSLETAYCYGPQGEKHTVHNWTGWGASYGGRWCLDDDPLSAALGALRPFAQALQGHDHSLPF